MFYRVITMEAGYKNILLLRFIYHRLCVSKEAGDSALALPHVTRDITPDTGSGHFEI